MGTTLIFVGQRVVTRGESRSGLPETDTGGQVEHTKALERMTLKELGNLPP